MELKEFTFTLTDISVWIKENILKKERTTNLYRYYNYETTKGIEILTGFEEFKLIEEIRPSPRMCFSTGLGLIKRVSNIESKTEICSRFDLPTWVLDPHDPSYGRWTYELEFEENGNVRKFLGKLNETDLGLCYSYCYPDFEMKGEEETELGTKNIVSNLFHDIFVHYASKRF